MSGKTVANVTFRLTLDATTEIVGKNGMKSLVNYAKLGYLLENMPDYSLEKGFTNQELKNIDEGFRTILGMSGASALYRIVGKTTGTYGIKMGLLDQFNDLTPEERLIKTVRLIQVLTDRGTVTQNGGNIIYDDPECGFCKTSTSNNPVCSFFIGLLDIAVEWSGVKNVRTIETKCKAMGDDVCRYEIVPVS